MYDQKMTNDESDGNKCPTDGEGRYIFRDYLKSNSISKRYGGSTSNYNSGLLQQVIASSVALTKLQFQVYAENNDCANEGSKTCR